MCLLRKVRMNGKKAKMLRRSGVVDKKAKKDYNKLNKFEREFLSAFYKAKQLSEEK